MLGTRAVLKTISVTKRTLNSIQSLTTSASQAQGSCSAFSRRHCSSHIFHSKPQRLRQADMRIKLVPALQDNYMYLLIDEKTKQCAAVDPVEPDKILSAAKEENVQISTVLTTHHHWDHAGGNKDLVKMLSDVRVYGGDDRIDAVTDKINHDDCFKIGELSVRCLFTPCHTSGHICYYVMGDADQDPVVFTGDTLFMAGCGRFFEGKPDQMYKNLVETLGGLPHTTKVFCGHEYTVANLHYAIHVEPNSPAIQEKLDWAKRQRSKNLPTIPSTIGDEFKFNPFMRVREPSVQTHTGLSDPIDVMGALRAEKDNFKPKL